MSTVLDVIHFILLTTFISAITVCLLVYKGQRSKSFLIIGIYFIAQTIIELDIRISEVNTPLTQWIKNFFEIQFTFMIKTLMYEVIIITVLLFALSILRISFKPKILIIPIIILIWMIIMDTVAGKDSNMIIYWAYLLPNEIFTFCISLFVIRRTKRGLSCNSNPSTKEVIVIMRMIMVFSVIIFIEDFVSAQYYVHLNVDSTGFTSPAADIYIKERNFSENILNIILAVNAIHVGEGMLTEEKFVEFNADAVKSPNVELNYNTAFAEYLGLSPRERDVLPLLLTNMDMNEISEKLIISYGTVKSHTHNIYKKAGVQNRLSLMKLAEEFRASSQPSQ